MVMDIKTEPLSNEIDHIVDIKTEPLSNEINHIVDIKTEPLSDDESPVQQDVPEIKNNCNCAVEFLLENKFSSLSYAEKEKIIKTPKPSPNLNINSVTKTFKRHFPNSVYENIVWICGCAHLSKLFCWPCVIFSSELNVWTKYGYCDLNNLSKARKKHECSQNHIRSRVQFKRFENENGIEFVLSDQYKSNVEQHNKEVTSNRYIFCKLIDIVCFLSKHDVSFRGHFEYTESENKGNYVDLLYFLSESDVSLQYHLDNAKVFKSILNNILNDLLSAISQVILDEIRSEIRSSKFISIIIDESTIIIHKSLLYMMFRYVDQTDNIQERFIGFIDLNEDETADALFDHIKNTLSTFECTDKLVSHTYDGAAVMTGEHKRIQKKILEMCPNSIFVHCYAHRLNLVLSQSINSVAGCKFFFQSLISFASFFSTSSKRMSILNCKIKKCFPESDPTEWRYTSRILNMVVEYNTKLQTIFDQMIDNQDEWDSDTVINARGLRHYLNDFDFNFNLILFLSIFNAADVLFEILQKNHFNISHCSSEIKKFVGFLNNKKDGFDSVWHRLDKDRLNNEIVSRKRKHPDYEKDKKSLYNLRWCEIIDIILESIKDLFDEMDSLKFMTLLDVTKFKEYKKNFPASSFTSLQKSYGEHFDVPKLKGELIYMYSSPEFESKSLNCLKNVILKNNLTGIIPEVYNLINLVLTIPSVEQTFSTAERIKTYSRNCRSEERLSSLALISVENNLLVSLKATDKLHNRVIEEFYKKEHRIELILK